MWAMIFQMTHQAKDFFNRIMSPEGKGQGLVEYALIILLIAVVVVAALGLFGEGVNNLYNQIVNGIPGD